MSNTLLLVVCAGFASGLLCRSLFIFPWQVPAFVFILATLSFAAWRIWPRLAYVVCAVSLLGFALGAGRVMLEPEKLPAPFVPLLETEVVLEGIVASEPDIRETTQRITVAVSKDGAETNVLAVVPLYPEVRFGSRVRIEGTFALPEPFETDTGRTFRYDRFLAKDGVFALVTFGSLTIIAPPEGILASGRGMLIDAKRTFQAALARAIPEPGASLASGLITGGKQGLGPELLDLFIVAGLVHIVVLSGYNVMIVAEGVLRALGFLPKRIAALAAGGTIILFVLAAGAGAASVRAGLMALLALVARATGRTYAVVRALLIVGIVMLLINPLLLAYDPGFQLSFMATLGLILLAPILESHLGFIHSPFWRDLIAATLAAQMAVLPILLYQTGLFSLVSVPANLLVLPVVPLAMALSALAGVTGALLPSLAPLLGLPAHLLLSYIIESARFFAALPLAAVSVPQFPFVVVVVLYGILAAYIRNAPVQKPAQVRSG